MANQGVSFIDLPRELRDMIYRYYFESQSHNYWIHTPSREAVRKEKKQQEATQEEMKN